MKKRTGLKCLIAVVGLSLMMAGCGGAKSDHVANMSGSMAGGSVPSTGMDYGYDNVIMEDSVDYDSMESVEPMDPPESMDPMASSKENISVVDERKLIKTVDMSVETKEFDTLLDLLQTRVTELGGYIERMESYNGRLYYGTRSNRTSSLTIRIPQDKLSGFLDEVSNGCNVIRRSENVTDVTLTYVDLESHKNVLLAEQERLLELIDDANYIEEIITIEQRLSHVRYQIESMESQLRTFDNKINYSTVSMYVEEVKELTPVEEKSTLRRIVDGFMDNLKDVGNGIKEFFVGFIICIPYLVVWGLVIFVIIIIVKKFDKRAGKKSIFKRKKDALNKAENTEQEIK